MNKKQFPVDAFRFFASAELDAPTDTGLRRFEGVAYSGEIITDHWMAPVGFDLATMTIPTPLPALFGHDDEEAVGVVDSVDLSGPVRLSGSLFSDVDECAKSISDKADRGFPWGMSLRIIPGSIEEVAPGVPYTLNGRSVVGPLTVFKNSRVREVSFCSVAADQRTSAAVFDSSSDQLTIEVHQMPDENKPDPRIADLEAKLTAAEAKFAAAMSAVEAEKARADAAEAALGQMAQASRKNEVQALFSAIGREFSDEAARPYMAMPAELFAAVSADLSALVKPKQAPADSAPDYLFKQVANGSTEEAPRSFDEINARLFKQLGGNA